MVYHNFHKAYRQAGDITPMFKTISETQTLEHIGTNYVNGIAQHLTFYSQST